MSPKLTPELLERANATSAKPFHVFAVLIQTSGHMYYTSFDLIGHALDFKDTLTDGLVTDRYGSEID